MNRRGFLKLLGIGAGAAVISAALPDILTPDDEAWEPVRRYWQGWSPYGIGERKDTWGVELELVACKEHAAIMKNLVDTSRLPRGRTYTEPVLPSLTDVYDTTPVKGGVFAKEALMYIKVPRWGFG